MTAGDRCSLQQMEPARHFPEVWITDHSSASVTNYKSVLPSDSRCTIKDDMTRANR
jgi:hypothetical protein